MIGIIYIIRKSPYFDHRLNITFLMKKVICSCRHLKKTNIIISPDNEYIQGIRMIEM